MSESYSLSLALFDFVPTLAFLAGGFFLVKTAVICRGRACGRMVMAGTLLVFLGGFLKAGWKLLYTLGVADVQWMSQYQFVWSSVGFLGLCVAVIYMVRRSRRAAGPPLLAILPWKIPFLFLMTVASLGAEGILSYIAFKRKEWTAAAGFVVGVLGLLAMGSLASAEQTVTMQWIEEIVNATGQIGFMAGSILLHRSFKRYGCEFTEVRHG